MKRPAIYSRLALSLCLCASLAPATFAQDPPRSGGNNPNNPPRSSGSASTHTVRGKVFLPSGNVPDQRIRVVLELSTGGVAGETFTDSVGNFEFRSLPPNSYRVVVPSDHQNFDTGTETVEVYGNFSRTYMVQVYLKEKGGGVVYKPADRVLTVADLQEVPKDAKKAYEQGLKRVRDQKPEEAVKYFQKAIGHFPDYLFAINKLGEQYLALQRRDEARAMFERAFKVSEKYPHARINLGIMLVDEKKFDEAIEHLEAANSIDTGYPMCHLYLGRAYMEKASPDLDRAEKELLMAAEAGGKELSYTRLYLFNLYLKRQTLDKAAEQLEAYLKLSPEAPNAPKVRETLGQLKKMLAEKNGTAKPQ